MVRGDVSFYQSLQIRLKIQIVQALYGVQSYMWHLISEGMRFDMAKKYYAVRQGRQTGVFLTWAECEAQVRGFSGAEYKSFPSKADAEAFCGQKGMTIAAQPVTTSTTSDYMSMALKADGDVAVAYVDGSFDKNCKGFSYGMLFIYQGEEVKYCERLEDEELALMHNVAGEIKGSEAAMKYAIQRGIKKLVIYHDYEGIAKWCNGAWKANKEGTKAYQAFYHEAAKHVAIKFVKVKGHSNDACNDIADELAKQALGIGEEKHTIADLHLGL